jgi:hypothetical protein
MGRIQSQVLTTYKRTDCYEADLWPIHSLPQATGPTVHYFAYTYIENCKQKHGIICPFILHSVLPTRVLEADLTKEALRVRLDRERRILPKC